MPAKPRSRAASSSASARKVSVAVSEAEEQPLTVAGGGGIDRAPASAAAPVESAPAVAAHRGHLITRTARLPFLAVRVVAHDVSSASRRPDTVAYWAGLGALAAFGVLDWPIAAAIGIGVGVAVASGARRARG